MNPTPHSMQHPITEDDIANFLANTPDFFERHAELLATVQLSSGHGMRAVSLQERQAGMLRDKIRGLESRLVEMLRHGQDNVAIADKMQSWTRQMLLASVARELPGIITRELQTQFQVPQVAIKVWDVAAPFAAEDFALGVSPAARDAAAALTAPFCGPAAGLEAVSWLDEPAAAQSVALIALRKDASAAPFGLLVLASPEADRFASGMGTDFLQRIGELASAALSRLQGPAAAGH
ncbi:MAG: hypothetical protein RLZZ03_529 [Pseudomonadota bacterium]